MELAVRTRRRWASSTSTQRYRSTPSASSSKPGSLETAREVSDEETLPAASMSGWRRLALTLGGYFSEESRHVRGGERLYAEVKAASSEDALYAAHGIERTFARDHAVTCLHVWMCLQRLRREGEDGKDFSQIFYDAFQDDVERRVHDAGVRVRVRKWLQDLERTFYGNAVSYDKALELGGSELARALHRNVYDGDGDVDKAKALERYVRHHVASLAITPTSAVIDGRIRFQRFN
ncbi:Ubiquinol-cytochrome c chaperone/UPF0174 [Ostreococcus tauri]|uniref:Ubiquinol-cytochrome c chaperone/UPF0174 n=2 Tax=Ostreococcus tauri TaxID=70448 RepID=A0A090LY60_OSTTA|nr:Ubiquinol-cytochrome c chaperone/UPF0174 [Ostreococcus tauri]CEF96810.1 Ubiquinol-cytochrome c chaperone/UPF0174 [Ostreococcus tauri]|eukprot:XP_022838306.1 Ubiquinol-cytochrome c chaperone/UPF0174 [Ostreococcus tauri]